MAISTGVLTEGGANLIRDAMLNGTVAPQPAYFKFGEGGWQTSGSTRVPRTPVATQTDLDAIQNPGLYPADSLYTFTGTFGLGDLTAEDPGTLKCRCLLDFADANDDGLGNDPEFYEIGVYAADDTLMGYCTFDRETKNALKQLEHYVRFNLGGS